MQAIMSSKREREKVSLPTAEQQVSLPVAKQKRTSTAVVIAMAEDKKNDIVPHPAGIRQEKAEQASKDTETSIHLFSSCVRVTKTQSATAGTKINYALHSLGYSGTKGLMKQVFINFHGSSALNTEAAMLRLAQTKQLVLFPSKLVDLERNCGESVQVQSYGSVSSSPSKGYERKPFVAFANSGTNRLEECYIKYE